MRRPWWILPLVLAAWLVYEGYQRFFVAAIDVTSEPAGAEVWIDGRRAGITPFTSGNLPPGMHQVTLRHSHFQPVERRLEVTTGERARLHVAFQPGMGELAVFSNPRGAWVEIDGERMPGTTPVELDLPSGVHEVALGMAERREAEQQVTVMPGERLELRLDLDMDPHGSLVIDTFPDGARVTLPDVAERYAPGMRLPMGEYRVQVGLPGYRTADARLPVRYGDNRHRIELERAFAGLRVITDPADAAVTVSYADDPGGPVRRRTFEPGAALPVGPVEIRASAMGRRSVSRRLDLGPDGATVRLTLAPMQVTPGERFRDDLASGGRGPEMIVLPAGDFVMGSASGPPSERPARRVTLTQPFAAGVYEVTVAEYGRFAAATGRTPEGDADAEPAWPVSQVSFEDAAAYADWLSEQTGARYRLPSEAEWEYLARGGATGEYFFGDDEARLCAFGNVGDRSLASRYQAFGAAACDDGFVEHAPVGSFPANAFGLHDVHGNVAEWVMECGLPAYADAPEDGAPVDASRQCRTHGVRGGGWDDGAADARLAKRNLASSPSRDRGFRIVRDL
ncbi:MAG: hypothetical protein CMQ43_07420 [Gammaproteobacteria bacterium]|nr:hypothetical protein [Gammaproteobacteria bacterium]